MIQTVEGVIDSHGNVRLPKDVRLPSGRRAIVTILDESVSPEASETAILSEEVLAEDWLREEEEVAWQHLQTEQ
jgi:virulence-associated protein VagC